MIRVLPLVCLLAGCTAPSTNQLYTPEGERIDIAYLVINPLCLFICNTGVTTSGVDQDTTGEGATGGTTSNTQTNNQALGSN